MMREHTRVSDRTPPAGARRSASRVDWERLGRISLVLILFVILVLYINPVVNFVDAWRDSGAEKAQLAELKQENAELQSRAPTLEHSDAAELGARRSGHGEPGRALGRDLRASSADGLRQARHPDAAPEGGCAEVTDRALSVGDYLLGAAELGLIVAALAFARFASAAWRCPASQDRPRWSRRRRDAHPGDPPGRAPGHLRSLHRSWVRDRVASRSRHLRARYQVPNATLTFRGPGPRRCRWRPITAASHPLALAIVAVVVAAIFAGWAIPTLSGITGGMGRADSLWYHMPLSARFAETGSTGEIFFFDPIFFASFYPANTEVLHAIPILTFGATSSRRFSTSASSVSA